MSDKVFKGQKGSKSSSPVRTPDTLRSEDTVEVILGISEGPIKGLVDGAKSFLIDDTPLENQNGESNFDQFELNMYYGAPSGETIMSKLGGFASSTTVGVSLASGVPVTRQGTLTDIDFLEVRLVFNQLYKQNDNGVFEADVEFQIEYKPASSQTWSSVYSNTTPTNTSTTFFGFSRSLFAPTPGDRLVFWSSVNPGVQPANSVWVASDGAPNLANIYVSDGSNWQIPSGLVELSSGAHYQWSGGTLFHGDSLPAEPSKGTIWLKSGTAYTYNGLTWILAGSTVVDDPDGDGVGTRPDRTPPGPGVVRLTGKTTQPYVKEFRWPVARISEPYEIRITRISPDSDTNYVCEFSWESFQEVTAQSFSWPNLAVAHLTAKATDQFSRIPQFSGIYEGRIVRVPTNYDPVNRTYTGVWDGTFKLEYTDNPAWIVLDLVENADYGLSKYYPIQMDKWAVYEAAQWCDVMVPDGKGGQQPRFTYNDYISDPRSGKEHITFLCGLFGGRFVDMGNGFASIKLDDDKPAVMLFTPENIVDGDFGYSYTDITTRYNDITVTFTNPDLNWQEDRRRVSDQAHIDEFGYIPHDFVAVGCIDEAEALRRARYKLITATTETETVQFKTNRQGLYLEPYDIILCADPDMGTGLTGRIKEVVDNTTFTLRDPVYLEAGLTYTVKFFRTNPDYPTNSNDKFVIETRTVDPSLAGEVTSLTVTSDLPPLAENAVFVLENSQAAGLAKPYRVISIEEAEGDPDQVMITAHFVNRTKWSYIDNGGTIQVPNYSVLSSGKVDPISNLTATTGTRQVGNRKVNYVSLTWDRSSTKLLKGYQILMARSNDPLQVIAETRDIFYEVEDLPPGDYLFGIRVVDIDGRYSDTVFISQSVVGEIRFVKPITNLRLVDEPSPLVFESISPTFAWDDGDGDPYTLDFKVRVTNNDTQVMVYETYTPELSWTFEYAANLAASGGNPPRNLKVEVWRRDQFMNLSDPVSLLVSNEPPAAPSSITAQANGNAIVVSVPDPGIRDFGGIVVHADTTPGFTPSAGNKIYQGPQTSLSFAVADGTWYVKVAYYDKYSAQNLIFVESAPVVVGEGGDTTPPGLPTGVTVTAGPSLLSVAWTNPADNDLSHVEVWVGPDSNVANAGFDGASLSDRYIVSNLTPGTTYYVFLRAVDKSGNKSGYTTGVSGTPVKIDGTLIDDNSIQSSHILANSILTQHIGAAQVTADKISITNLEAINVKVRNADIENLTIGGEKIQDNAISYNAGVSANNLGTVASTGSASGASYIFPSVGGGGGWAKVLEVTVPTSGTRTVKIDWLITFVATPGFVFANNAKYAEVRIARGTYPWYTYIETISVFGQGAQEIQVSSYSLDNPAASPGETYQVHVRGIDSSGNLENINVSRRSMYVLELKK